MMLKVLARRTGWTIVAAACVVSPGQQPRAGRNGAAERRAEATATRDLFVKSTVAAGMSCPTAPPNIVVEDVPGYASYHSATNSLKTGTWEQLTSDEKGRFFGMLGPGATEDEARAEFDIGANHWVFMRVLEGWWQACRNIPETGSAYSFESGVNRVEAAFWREQDPSILAHMRKVFQSLQGRVPSPVPPGQSVAAYYDAHYPNKFKGPEEYLWFQARMCLTLFDEKPGPTFAQALRDISASGKR